jgi:hypothetical protein
MLNILWLRCGVAKRLALACLQQGMVPGFIPGRFPVGELH